MSNERCPACFQIKEGFTGKVGAGNAFSRYVDVYICSDCGRREAFEKFFWSKTCPASLLRISAKRRGMSVRDLVSLCVVAGGLLISGGHADAGWRYTSTGPYGGASTYCYNDAYGTHCDTRLLGPRTGNDARVINVPDRDEPLPPPSARTCGSPSVVCLDASTR